MGKGKGRCVVRNKVLLVNICCVVSDPTSYNWPQSKGYYLKSGKLDCWFRKLNLSVSCQCFCNQNFLRDIFKCNKFSWWLSGKNCVPFCIQQQGSTIKNTEDFMSEASIMGQFRHPNVILLVGVVTISTYTVHVVVYSFVCVLLLFFVICLFACFF